LLIDRDVSLTIVALSRNQQLVEKKEAQHFISSISPAIFSPPSATPTEAGETAIELVCSDIY
jgi:hypothetical protein